MKLKFTPRLYQEEIFNSAVSKNTLVVLPTGTGKTLIAFMLIINRLKKYPATKAVFLAPTKPLSAQHQSTFVKSVESNFQSSLLTGEIKQKERKLLWNESDIVFATPQTIRNDLKTGTISLDDVSLLIIDEAHRAVGDYAYVYVAQRYADKAKYPRILALTASPATERAKLEKICNVLSTNRIEIRTEEDLKEFIPEKLIEKVEVDFPSNLVKIRSILNVVLSENIKILEGYKMIRKPISKRKLIFLQKKVQNDLKRYKHFRLYKALFLIALIIKIHHIIEMLESYGPSSVLEYYQKLKDSKTKSAKALVEDKYFMRAINLCHELVKKGVEHPKLIRLKEILEQEYKEGFKVMIFTHFRASAKMILNALKKTKFKPVLFIGKAGIDGLKQDQQIEILEKFRRGEYDTLVATSIGEEGISIESSNIGVLFDAVPSAVRRIQRSGRIGRTMFGKLFYLITKGTVDEKYDKLSEYKETKMKKMVKRMSQSFKEPKLVDYK